MTMIELVTSVLLMLSVHIGDTAVIKIYEPPTPSAPEHTSGSEAEIDSCQDTTSGWLIAALVITMVLLLGSVLLIRSFFKILKAIVQGYLLGLISSEEPSVLRIKVELVSASEPLRYLHVESIHLTPIGYETGLNDQQAVDASPTNSLMLDSSRYGGAYASSESLWSIAQLFEEGRSESDVPSSHEGPGSQAP